ncbi:thioredoxin, mitochondrial isoform X2 [Drosophila ananassae]|uniref:thioredoxin, mitochondrial isoform X2 n=1 Tax=Drosophila ananassae TaxID=7217 RepID=UPI0013A5CED5|nr:thioredoxin, mitochondrial isoform X2 [Drosophila ananassae]
MGLCRRRDDSFWFWLDFASNRSRYSVINSDNPVIVNFHAEWCDPCKILTPKMLELLENSSEIDLAVIDVETNLDLVETFEVKAVPAVLAFRNGVVVDKFIGLVDANSIETLIDKLKRKQQQKQ